MSPRPSQAIVRNCKNGRFMWHFVAPSGGPCPCYSIVYKERCLFVRGNCKNFGRRPAVFRGTITGFPLSASRFSCFA